MKKLLTLVLVLSLTLSIVYADTTASASNDPTPIAYWDFDEGSGTVIEDKTGNGHNATKANAEWIDGFYGKAIKGTDNTGGNYPTASGPAASNPIGGYDTTMEVGKLTKALAGSSAITVTGMYKRTSGYANRIIAIFGTSAMGVELYTTEKGFKYGGRSISSDSYQQMTFESSTALGDGVWHSFALVVDYANNKTTGYIDGVKIKEEARTFKSQTYSFSTANSLGIPDHMCNAQSVLDNVAIYNTALTEQQIIDLQLPVAKWEFDETNANVVTDTYGHKMNYAVKDNTTAERQEGLFGNSISGTVSPATTNTGNYVSGERGLPLKALSGASQVSASFWVKQKDDATVSADRMIFKVESAKGAAFNCFAANNGGIRVGGRSGANDGFQSQFSSVGLNDKKWHHIFVSLDYKGKRILVYRDGEKVTEKTGVAFGSDYLSLAVSGSAYDEMIGNDVEVDRLAIYAVLPSETVIKKLAQEIPPVRIKIYANDGTTLTPITDGKLPLSGDLKIKYELANQTSVPMNFVGIAGIYSNDGKLLDAAKTVKLETALGFKGRDTKELDIPAELFAGKTVDIFGWNGLNTLVPYNNCVELK